MRKVLRRVGTFFRSAGRKVAGLFSWREYSYEVTAWLKTGEVHTICTEYQHRIGNSLAMRNETVYNSVIAYVDMMRSMRKRIVAGIKNGDEYSLFDTPEIKGDLFNVNAQRAAGELWVNSKDISKLVCNVHSQMFFGKDTRLRMPKKRFGFVEVKFAELSDDKKVSSTVETM